MYNRILSFSLPVPVSSPPKSEVVNATPLPILLSSRLKRGGQAGLCRSSRLGANRCNSARTVPVVIGDAQVFDSLIALSPAVRIRPVRAVGGNHADQMAA